MKIIDLDGKEITVTDLELAIMQADDYRHFRHTDPSFKQLNEGSVCLLGRCLPKIAWAKKRIKFAPDCHLLLSSATGSPACWVA